MLKAGDRVAVAVRQAKHAPYPNAPLRWDDVPFGAYGTIKEVRSNDTIPPIFVIFDEVQKFCGKEVKGLWFDGPELSLLPWSKQKEQNMENLAKQIIKEVIKNLRVQRDGWVSVSDNLIVSDIIRAQSDLSAYEWQQVKEMMVKLTDFAVAPIMEKSDKLNG